MIKFLRSSLCTLLTACLILATVSAPSAYGSHRLPRNVDTSNELYEYIIRNSKKGDGGDIKSWIIQYLNANPTAGDKFVDELIKRLKKKSNRVAFNVVVKDLDRVKKSAKNWIKNNPNRGGGTGGGTLTGSTSPTGNR